MENSIHVLVYEKKSMCSSEKGRAIIYLTNTTITTIITTDNNNNNNNNNREFADGDKKQSQRTSTNTRKTDA